LDDATETRRKVAVPQHGECVFLTADYARARPERSDDLPKGTVIDSLQAHPAWNEVRVCKRGSL